MTRTAASCRKRGNGERDTPAMSYRPHDRTPSPMPLARLARRSPLALALALAAAGTLAAAAVASSRVVPPAGLVRAEPIGDLSAASAGHGERAVALPLRYAHPGQLLAAKRAAFRRYRRARKHAGARRRASHIRFKGTVFAGLNAPGFAFTAGSEASGYATPSDTTGAVGPSNYVQFTNGHLVVYDRSLAPVSGGESPIESFVGLPSGTDVAGDPQMQWDPVAQRWYYLSYAS